MISLEQPSMALNDGRARIRVQMWNTWNIQRGEPRDHIISWTADVARRALGGKLRNVVIYTHGGPGFIDLGEGFDRRHTSMFSGWAGLVEKIWFMGCRVAFIHAANAPQVGDGNAFCSEIARAARCYVIASTETQFTISTTKDASGHFVLPYGQLDAYEGLLLAYGPQGRVVSSRRFPSSPVR